MKRQERVARRSSSTGCRRPMATILRIPDHRYDEVNHRPRSRHGRTLWVSTTPVGRSFTRLVKYTSETGNSSSSVHGASLISPKGTFVAADGRRPHPSGRRAVPQSADTPRCDSPSPVLSRSLAVRESSMTYRAQGVASSLRSGRPVFRRRSRITLPRGNGSCHPSHRITRASVITITVCHLKPSSVGKCCQTTVP